MSHSSSSSSSSSSLYLPFPFPFPFPLPFPFPFPLPAPFPFPFPFAFRSQSTHARRPIEDRRLVSASSRERGEIRVGDERWIGTDVAVMRAQSILCSSILRVVETKIFRGVRDRGSFRHFYASCVFSLVLCTLFLVVVRRLLVVVSSLSFSFSLFERTKALSAPSSGVILCLPLFLLFFSQKKN